MTRICFSVLLVLTACSGATSRNTATPGASVRSMDAPEAARQLNGIADDYYRESLKARPLRAFSAGVLDAPLDRVDDNSLAALTRWEQQEDTWLERLRAISPSLLAGAPEAALYAVLRYQLESAVSRRVCHDELWAARQQGGVQQLPTSLATLQPVGNAEQRRKALSRFRSLAPFFDTAITNLREGLRRGYTSPRVTVDAVIEQLDGLLAIPPDSSPILVMAEQDGSPAFRAELIALLRTSLYPALSRYRQYLVTTYRPRSRTTTAITALPQGQECYRARVRQFTSLDLEPAAIHQLGLDEMEKIEREARDVAQRQFGTTDLPALYERFRSDPKLKFGSKREVLDTANAALARVRARLDRWFGRLPRAEMIVDPCLPFEEKSGCPNSYVRPAQDGSRPGRWRINTNPLRASRVDLEAVAFHEGYPGHHLQVALAQERGQAHPVTHLFFISGFGEGWGLYSERLANEMGAYSGNLAQLGRLSLSAWRAARLVVDPGLHVLGWSRERAIDYMLAHTALSRQGVVSEVDRYIINPGQATAYLVGRLEIERLRSEAEARLGSRFDIRAFHDKVLEHGSVPLPFLRQQVEQWLAATATGRQS
jgi:uncharacterized protein (DUF885 family)